MFEIRMKPHKEKQTLMLVEVTTDEYDMKYGVVIEGDLWLTVRTNIMKLGIDKGTQTEFCSGFKFWGSTFQKTVIIQTRPPVTFVFHLMMNGDLTGTSVRVLF